ncbi:hypothetical protein [Scytonema sp. NUACC26]|uniref:hypothetical protein n=1 Tax=Scytonema sp. NUACC26 TaxID=3140176 RepID=UPI0034DC9475
MKAYEFSAKITPDGKLELPDMQLENLSNKSVVRVIVLIEETSHDEAHEEDEDEDNEKIESAVESFRRSWYQARF